VAQAGFQATVKGDGKKDLTSVGSMRPVAAADVRSWFNASADSVRVIFLLSPACPYCQSGHKVLKTLFGKTTSLDLKAFLVWLPMYSGDDEQQAVRQASTFEDPRLTEGWDGPRAIGDLFARRLELGGTAWDVYLVYDRGVTWDDGEPPAPSFWMHQLTTDVGADQSFCLDPASLVRSVLARLERRG